MKRKLGLNLFFVLAAVITTLCLAGPTQAAVDIPIVIAWQPSPDFVFYIAQAKGFFKEAGLSPKYVKFAGGPPFLAAIRSGDIDVGFIGYPPLIYGMAENLEYKIIYATEDSGPGHGLVVKNGSNIKSFKDQKNKKIGVMFGSASHWGVMESFRQNGIGEKDVKLINLTPSVGVSALVAGDVDGFFCWQPWSFIAMEKAEGRMVGTMTDLGLHAGAAWVARNEFLEKNTEAVQRFFKAMELADEFLFGKDKRETAELIAPVFGISMDMALKIVETVNSVKLENQITGDPLSMGTYAKRGESGMAKSLDQLARFLFEQQKIKIKPNISSFIDTRPIEKYLSKMKRK